MVRRITARRIAVLWSLAWNGDRLLCAIYRRGGRGALELRLESETATVLAEPFEVSPRMIARANALKRSLKRRGWQEDRQPP